jgi:proteasome lid subunit RPN8/RPN11/outer membrane murein-binding lipoprotein Lpp
MFRRRVSEQILILISGGKKMAKKQKKKQSKGVEKISFDKVLPQNILPMGERVEEDKNIYISQAAYKEIREFTKNKTTNESGGMLIGNVIEEFGKTNIVIHGFVEAKYSEGTPTTLKFTHETWEYVHREIEKKYEDVQIVGWIHTHPDFGIFLSEYDKFIQQNFFKEDYQIAYVVDPIQHIEGFYFWINETIEKCKGFYIFDKTGEKIDIEETEKKDITKSIVGGNSNLTYIICGALVIITLTFAIMNVNLRNRMAILESQQENLVNSANQSIGIMQQQISGLSGQITQLESDIDSLNKKLKAATGTDAVEENTDTDDKKKEDMTIDSSAKGTETTDVIEETSTTEESTETKEE